MATETTVRIHSERTCICCAVTVGYPEPDCEIHGMDACHGRYDSCWWGRIRLPLRVKTTPDALTGGEDWTDE